MIFKSRDLALTILLLVLLTGCSTSANAESSSSELCGISALQSVYDSVNSVYLRAVSTIQFHRSTSDAAGSGARSRTPASIRASLSYWAIGERYLAKARSQKRPELELVPDSDVAFNGSEYQTLVIPDETLYLKKSVGVMMPSVLPNPFLLPAEFLSQHDGWCQGCSLKISDVRDAGLWNRRKDSVSFVAYTLPGKDAPIVRLPGVDHLLQPIEFEVQFGNPCSSGRVERISQHTLDGNKTVEILFDDYQAVKGMSGIAFFPKSITVKYYDFQGDWALWIEQRIDIVELVINKYIDEEVFTIEHTPNLWIKDEDTGELLQRPTGPAPE